MPSDSDSSLIRNSLLRYSALLCVTLAGFVPFIALFALFAPVMLGFLAAGFLVLYLPLLEWPWLAWRTTGRLGVVALAFCAALIPALVLPLSINASQQRLATQDQDRDEKTQLPAEAFVAREILIYQGQAFTDAQGCGPYCRALLWSGAKDHVLATRSYGGDHVDHALLYSLRKMDVCPGPEFGREKPRDGLCLTWREVTDPWFDAVLEDWGLHDNGSLTLFAGKPWAQRGVVKIYDCRKLCEQVLLMHPVQATRLAIPAYPVFAFGIDSGGPVGLRYSERPFTAYPPQDVLKLAFGLDTRMTNPRPGFSGDVAQGGPLLPTAKYFRDLEMRKTIEDTQEKLRQVEQPLEIYREKLKALRAQHADCASPIISPGPEPQYQGCSSRPASEAIPTFSMVQDKAAGR